MNTSFDYPSQPSNPNNEGWENDYEMIRKMMLYLMKVAIPINSWIPKPSLMRAFKEN